MITQYRIITTPTGFRPQRRYRVCGLWTPWLDAGELCDYATLDHAKAEVLRLKQYDEPSTVVWQEN